MRQSAWYVGTTALRLRSQTSVPTIAEPCAPGEPGRAWPLSRRPKPTWCEASLPQRTLSPSSAVSGLLPCAVDRAEARSPSQCVAVLLQDRACHPALLQAWYAIRGICQCERPALAPAGDRSTHVSMFALACALRCRSAPWFRLIGLRSFSFELQFRAAFRPTGCRLNSETSFPSRASVSDFIPTCLATARN